MSSETQVRLINKDDYVPSASEISHNASKRMKEQAAKTDSKAVQHVADIMTAQDKLVSDKDLDKRLARIAKLTKAVRKRSPGDYQNMQRQVESLKPLLRQAVESPGFRSSMIGLLKTLERVFRDRQGDNKKQGEKAKEKVKDKVKDSDKQKDKHKQETSKKDSDKPKDMQETKGTSSAKELRYETEIETKVVLPAPTWTRHDQPYLREAVQHPLGFAPPPPSSYPPAVVDPSHHTSQDTATTTLRDELHHGRESMQKKEQLKRQEEREFLTDKQWKKVEDGLDQFFTEVQKHPEYRKGVNQLFDIAGTFDPDMISSHDPTLVKLRDETRDLIAQFSGEDVLQKLFDHLEELTDMLDDNNEAQAWWTEFREHFKKLCKNYKGKEDLRSARAHFDKVPHIFAREKKKINKILHLLQEVFQNLMNDEYVKSIKNKISILGDDLYYTDSDGRKRFDLNAVRDITGAIVDILKKELRNIELPDIEGEDRKGSFSFRKLRIKTKFPSKIKFTMDTELIDHVSRKTGKTKYRARFVLHCSIKHIRVSAKNVEFAFRRTGISDSGIMDVTIPSASLYIDFIFAPTKNRELLKDPTKMTDSKTGEYNFTAVQSTFRVVDIEINYHKDTMTHNILVPLATRFAKRPLIKNLQSSIERTIDSRSEQLGNNMAKSFGNNPLPFSFGGKQPQETAE